MIFLTKADVLKLIDSDTLNVLTDADDTNLDAPELTALAEMTGYLNVRYDVETIFDSDETRNALIVQHLCDIVIYHMHAAISPDNIPELRETRYKNVIDWLEKVADGFLSPKLPIKGEEEKYPIRYGNSSEKQNQYY